MRKLDFREQGNFWNGAVSHTSPILRSKVPGLQLQAQIVKFIECQFELFAQLEGQVVLSWHPCINICWD